MRHRIRILPPWRGRTGTAGIPTRPIVLALRWAALAIGLAATALNAGCGGGGAAGIDGLQSRQSDGASNLYLATLDSGGVIDQSRVTGSTDTPLSPASVPAGRSPVGLVDSPSHAFAYSADASSNSVYQYALNATGALAALTPAQVALGASGSPTSIAEDATGRYVYVADTAAIDLLTVSSNGALALAGRTAVPGTPMSIAAAGDTVFATVFNTSGNSLLAYRIGSGGVLAQSASVALGGASAWDSLAVDPAGRYLYVVREGAGTNTGSLAAYAIDSGGSLTAIGTPLDGGNPTAAVVDSTGVDLFVLDGIDIRALTLAGSSLVESAPAPLPIAAPAYIQAPFAPTAPALSTTQVLVDPSGASVYAVGASPTVYAVPIHAAAFTGPPRPVRSTVNPPSGAAIAAQ